MIPFKRHFLRKAFNLMTLEISQIDNKSIIEINLNPIFSLSLTTIYNQEFINLDEKMTESICLCHINFLVIVQLFIMDFYIVKITYTISTKNNLVISYLSDVWVHSIFKWIFFII